MDGQEGKKSREGRMGRVNGRVRGVEYEDGRAVWMSGKDKERRVRAERRGNM